MPDEAIEWDGARVALAYARAFSSKDREGALAMLVSLPVDQIADFASMMVLMIRNAIAVGGIDERAFYDTMGELLERKAAEG